MIIILEEGFLEAGIVRVLRDACRLLRGRLPSYLTPLTYGTGHQLVLRTAAGQTDELYLANTPF